ncbi:MAG: J domain-containing protein [Parcubacteria group bacterium]
MATEEAERKACGVLGVEYPSSWQEIRTAFRKRVKKVHPDLSGTRETEDKFKEATEAYQFLKGLASRREVVEKTTRRPREEKGKRKMGEGEGEKKLPDFYTKHGEPDYQKSERGKSRGRL